MVETTGFEPATSCSRSKRSTKLSHVSMCDESFMRRRFLSASNNYTIIPARESKGFFKKPSLKRSLCRLPLTVVDGRVLHHHCALLKPWSTACSARLVIIVRRTDRVISVCVSEILFSTTPRFHAECLNEFLLQSLHRIGQRNHTSLRTVVSYHAPVVSRLFIWPRISVIPANRPLDSHFLLANRETVSSVCA